jgi:putative hemolysin
MLTSLFVVIVLVGVNALYVAAEFAAVSVRKSRIRQMAEDGHALARRLLPVLERPVDLDRYIAACQVGITLSSLVLGAYGQVAFTPTLSSAFGGWFGLEPLTALSAASLTVLISLTVGQMVVGELIPKSIALQFPTQTAVATYLPMRWSLIVLGPFIWLLNGSGNVVLRLFGDEHASHRHIHSPDEIELLIAESRDGGLLEPDETRRLQRALRFSMRTAGQLMVPRSDVKGIDIATPVDDVLDIAFESTYARMPVYDGSLDHIVGILNTRDLLVRQLEQRPVANLRTLLQPALTVRQSLTGDQLVGLLRERRSHQAIVQDDNGTMVGIVTLDNVLSALLGPTPDEFRDISTRVARPAPRPS